MIVLVFTKKTVEINNIKLLADAYLIAYDTKNYGWEGDNSKIERTA